MDKQTRNLVYRASFRTGFKATEKACVEKQKQTKKKKERNGPYKK